MAKKPLIFVVEDDVFLSNAYRVKLEKVGYEVVIVADGDKAISWLETQVPDLVLLDLIMPGKDGFAVLEFIRKQQNLLTVPVLVSSNLSQAEDMSKAMSLGATDYFVKADESLSDIVIKIEKYLRHPAK